MSYQIDGVTWTPETTNEHALKWIESLNALLEENDVRDSAGNIIKLTPNYANALYLQILAGANRLSNNDQKLQRAINSFNIELCDEQQIQNLLPIAAITRNPGSYSTLTLTATASENGDCTIPAGTKAPFGSVNFVVQTTVFLEAGSTQNIETVCDTVGAVTVLTGEITAFDVKIPNLENVVNNTSSTPGNAAETTASIRQRILRGQTIPYSVDGVKLAIEELTGINHARVYFNYNTNTNMTLEGGIVLQPRHAYIVVNGQSAEIAATYAKYMSAPTQNAPDASPTGTKTTVNVLVTAGVDTAIVPKNTSFIFGGMAFVSDDETEIEAETTATVAFSAVDVGAVIIPAGAVTSFRTPVDNVVNITNEPSVPGIPRTAYEQDYITGSGQIIPIKYDVAQNQTVFVKVYLQSGAEDGTQIRNQIKRDLIASSANWIIGQAVTSLLTGAVFANCSYTDVAYTMVSTDGVNWQNIVSVAANSVPLLNDSSIFVEGL